MIVTIALLSGGLAPAAPPRSGALALTADVAALEYAYTLVDGRATAPNRAQGLRSTLEGAGVRVVPREADPATDAVGWELGLRLVAWGRGEELPRQ